MMLMVQFLLHSTPICVKLNWYIDIQTVNSEHLFMTHPPPPENEILIMKLSWIQKKTQCVDLKAMQIYQWLFKFSNLN